ncbi:Integral membrane protein MviN [Acidipropionibacterium acidipropionici ATCC 4875]|uniref:Integral membrane protein MviN n=1 Tax=Acidipropionibacterium acidipropionici (strain ATCC 4875 / DSM 20272 / JCM 6432 / NBRC 12425 / NCIMB 8070 / 4) TaxID=1171373 RepID=K7RQ95_ACIA4|nr:murein biosynthesis integral membrane protein MurJ [Acidipropionibacterium acidipropionici]AFV88461.1 Integral membrane protein MviN [Acidipropionibacterium acidipropionici ATCC 4875]ALN14176.1 murein biosynthesis protein MurJ [Acidipropionibacterium acidipropionici]APZ10060.1 lipid II flippase MurJ [Acidipropionibacterium acidipropionici]
MGSSFAETDVYDLLKVPEGPRSPTGFFDVYDSLDVDATMLRSDLVARIHAIERAEDQERRARMRREAARGPRRAASPDSATTGMGLPAVGTPVAADGTEIAAGTLPGEAAKSEAEQTASLKRESSIMAAGTLISKILGLIRGFLLSFVMLGTGLAYDTFQAANTLPNVIFNLLSAGVLNAILIPQIVKAMKRKDGGREFVDRLLTVSFAAVVLVAVLATVGTPWLLNLSFSGTGPARTLAVMFGFICMPQILFYGVYAILGQVLNARGQFAAFMWSPVLANVIQISGLVWCVAQFGRHGDPAGWSSPMVWVVAGTTTLGIAVQGLSLIIPLWRGGFRWRPRWGIRGYGLGAAGRLTMWTFSALLIAQMVGIATKKMLSWVRVHNPQASSISAYDNAFLIFMLPHGLITVSILTALFPRMSSAHADGDTDGLRSLVRRGLTSPAVAIIPCSIAMVVLARPGVQTILSLQPEQVIPQAGAVAIMGIGLLPFGISTLQQRYCFAREDGRQNLIMQSILSGTQLLVASLVFVVPASIALWTVAAAQTLANIAVSVVWIVVASRQMNGLGMRSIARQWLRLLAAAVAAGVPTGVAVWAIGLLGEGRLLNLLNLAVGGCLFVGLFLLVAKLLKIEEVASLVTPILRKLHVVK